MRRGNKEEGNSMVIDAVCVQVVVQKRLRCVCRWVCRGGRGGCAEVGEVGVYEMGEVCVQRWESWVCRCVFSQMSYLGEYEPRRRHNFADCPLHILSLKVYICVHVCVCACVCREDISFMTVVPYLIHKCCVLQRWVRCVSLTSENMNPGGDTGLNFADCPLSFKVTGHCKWASFLTFP